MDEVVEGPPANKPPIGVMPYPIWKAKVSGSRAVDLADAMFRFADAGKPIPLEWVVEINNLIHEVVEARDAV